MRFLSKIRAMDDLEFAVAILVFAVVALGVIILVAAVAAPGRL